MRSFAVLSLFIAVHLAPAAIDDENSPNEIPYYDPTEDTQVDNTTITNDNTTIGLGSDLEEVYIFSEDDKYEEIDLITISRYIPSMKLRSTDDESHSHVCDKDEIERNKNTPPKPVRKKRQASCSNTDQPTFNCDAESKYRTFDGSCNNLQHPEWGMALGCQERFLQANYKGKADFRDSVQGGLLPEPRELSLHINVFESHPDLKRTHMSMFFGQFIAHDLVLTPMFATDTGEVLPCCDTNLRKDVRCANIYTRKDDPFYGPLNHTCMDFPRSVSCSSCDKKGRKLLNMNTAFLDGSLVYGNSENDSMSLRTNDGTGKLISQMSSQGELLPNSSDPQHDQCSFPDKDLICFEAGDVRVNQHILITCLQTIFLREHNRIATILKELNPSWGEERLFQESRRIVGAEIQSIIYKDYLPSVLDSKWIIKYQLGLSDGLTTYNETYNPSIWIEFSTAAFRVPHSTINTVVSTKPRDVTEGNQWLRDLYSLPFGLRKGGIGPLVADTARTPAQKADRYAVQDTNDYLYRVPDEPGGLDLSAVDIQRGRDNGLPTYTQMVDFCFGIEINTFADFLIYDLISLSDVIVLQKNYASPKDVDLETAMQMEKKTSGSVFGPTSSCVVGFQFRNLKFGDRFYFTHANQSGSFTTDQIEELKKITLTQIICKNVEGISYLPENAMLFPNPKNPEVNCSETLGPDFSKWKEES